MEGLIIDNFCRAYQNTYPVFAAPLLAFLVGRPSPSQAKKSKTIPGGSSMKAFQCKLSLALLTSLFTVAAHADNISVDCRPGAKGITTIGAAVAKIAAESVKKALPPSTITVTGPCVENVSIASLDNVTLQASPAGASISDASNGTLDTV